MKLRQLSILLLSASLLAGAVSAQQTITLEELRRMAAKSKTMDKKKEPAKVTSPTPFEPADKVVAVNKKDTTFLAEGSYSKMEKPYIYVARDAASLESLESMIGEFEPKEEVNFKTHAVVAAFSGEKNTGGYSVSIKMKDGKCVVEDIAPVHGAIVTEALTMPFTVVKVPIGEEQSVILDAGSTWMSGMERFEVTEGNFEYSGGFRGMEHKFGLAGSVYVMKFEEHVSFVFDLHGTGSDSARKLNEIVSGTMNDEKPVVNRLEAASLYERPHPPLSIGAIFDGDKLMLKFEPGKRDYVVNDGFEGRGSLTAVLRVAQ